MADKTAQSVGLTAQPGSAALDSVDAGASHRQPPSSSSASSEPPAAPDLTRPSLPAVPSAMAAEAKKPLDISNLMSPPEPAPFDTFGHGPMSALARAPSSPSPGKRSVPHPPLSPPISPFAKPASAPEASSTIHVAVQDPILYPGSDASASPPQPLFDEDEPSVDARRLVDEHLAARPTTLFVQATPPEREHYELALYFKSEVMKKFMKNPRGWLRKEREQLLADRRANAARNHVRRPLKNIAAAEGTRPVVRAALDRVTKPQTAPSSSIGHAKSPAKVKMPRPIRVNPQPARSPRHVSPTPEPRSRTIAPNREDKDFSSLPDYCPPLSALPNKQNSLKVDWKGNALDLSNDPFRHLLHPDELALAAGLRLDCATYLTSKRRIFMRRLECFRIGKEFRKTDAQQACKIDVNKASKLWTAYEKVGWLDKEWMRQFA